MSCAVYALTRNAGLARMMLQPMQIGCLSHTTFCKQILCPIENILNLLPLILNEAYNKEAHNTYCSAAAEPLCLLSFSLNQKLKNFAQKIKIGAS